MTQPLTIDVAADVFPIAGSFRISRGAKTEAHVVVVRMVLRGGGQEWQGWGECVPYARYGETVEGCLAQAGLVARTLEKDALKALGAKKGPGESLAADLAAVLAALQERLQEILAPGAARNAVDCALWDLRAAVAGQSVRALLGLPALLAPLRTAETLSLDAPAAMAARAKAKADRPLLKLKLGAEKSADCLKAIRAAAPEAALIVDANEAWAPEALPELFALCSELGVAMIEQPLPADDDQALAEIARPVPVYADESCHTAEGLVALKDRYDGINI
ncbi:MAG: enolase C-terminal domain-like protein, partial [Rhodospirillaceae bacterium]